jgi:hypothetical protein
MRKKTGNSWNVLPRKWPRKPICSATFFTNTIWRCWGQRRCFLRRNQSGRRFKQTAQRVAVHPAVHADDESRLVFRADQHGVPHHAARDECADGIADPALPVLTRILTQAADESANARQTAVARRRVVFRRDRRFRCYITLNHGRIFLLTTHAPVGQTNNAPPVLWDILKNAVAENIFHQHVTSGDLTSDAIDRLRQLVNETKTEVPGLNIAVTGESVLDDDEMTQSQKGHDAGQHRGAGFCAR